MDLAIDFAYFKRHAVSLAVCLFSSLAMWAMGARVLGIIVLLLAIGVVTKHQRRYRQERNERRGRGLPEPDARTPLPTVVNVASSPVLDEIIRRSGGMLTRSQHAQKEHKSPQSAASLAHPPGMTRNFSRPSDSVVIVD